MEAASQSFLADFAVPPILQTAAAGVGLAEDSELLELVAPEGDDVELEEVPEGEGVNLEDVLEGEDVELEEELGAEGSEGCPAQFFLEDIWMDDLLDFFDLSAGFSKAEVKAAYLRKVVRHHPDKGGLSADFDFIKQARLRHRRELQMHGSGFRDIKKMYLRL